MGRQVRALAGGVDVLVATPGRLLDLMQSNAVRLDRIEAFVLDEADRMLDMGFIHDIRKIIARLPARRQTLMFSATMPKVISQLAEQMLKDPVRVAVTPVASTAERIAQRVIHVDRNAKAGMLAELLRTERIDRALVFTRTKHGADKVVRTLSKSGLPAEAIHGNKSQNQRQRVLANFREGRVRILIATDIAARGIDVEGISHVINFDLPNIPESYVHRIGRTARAGADGVAISLCSHDERPFLRDIEKLIGMAISSVGQESLQVRQPAQQRHDQNRHQQRKANGKRGSHGEQRHKGNGHRHHQNQNREQAQHRSERHSEQTRTPHHGFADVAFMRSR